jgi:hypothetical protein
MVCSTVLWLGREQIIIRNLMVMSSLMLGEFDQWVREDSWHELQAELAVCEYQQYMFLMFWVWEIQTVVDNRFDLKGEVQLDMSVETLFLVLARRVVSK